MTRPEYSPIKQRHYIQSYENKTVSPCFSIIVSIFITIVVAKILNLFTH